MKERSVLQERYGLDFFEDYPSWRHQLIRLLAEVRDGGGDFFEILEVAKTITPGDEKDWFSKWHEAGTRNYRTGDAEDRKGRGETARDSFLKASNYFRMADFYLDRYDRRELLTYRRAVKSFMRAAAHFDHVFEAITIPYDGKSIPGYFLAPAQRREMPVVILMGGADAMKEEYYFRGARQILERGMACLLADGPGQGAMLRSGVYAPYDYERPISAIVDYLSARVDVDRRRIGLVASSLGGYFSVRATAFEKRVAAAVAWSAVYDVLEDVYDYFPPIQRRLRWDVGAGDDSEAREKLAAFTLKGVVEKVRCPLLVVHGEEDYVTSVNGAMKVYREATCPKMLRMFKKGRRGAAHAQQDDLETAKSFVFDWVKEKLRGAKR
jgi:alpha-beta hydrolase superfamily lysophospholipase